MRDGKETVIVIDEAHRLKVARTTEPIFSDTAIKIIFEHSGGIPRRINRLCDLCLLASFSQKVNQIDEQIVNNELQSLGS